MTLLELHTLIGVCLRTTGDIIMKLAEEIKKYLRVLNEETNTTNVVRIKNKQTGEVYYGNSAEDNAEDVIKQMKWIVLAPSQKRSTQDSRPLRWWFEKNPELDNYDVMFIRKNIPREEAGDYTVELSDKDPNSISRGGGKGRRREKKSKD